MPEGKDPDDFIKQNGKDGFVSLLKDKQIIQTYIYCKMNNLPFAYRPLKDVEQIVYFNSYVVTRPGNCSSLKYNKGCQAYVQAKMQYLTAVLTLISLPGSLTRLVFTCFKI